MNVFILYYQSIEILPFNEATMRSNIMHKLSVFVKYNYELNIY